MLLDHNWAPFFSCLLEAEEPIKDVMAETGEFQRMIKTQLTITGSEIEGTGNCTGQWM